MASIILSQTASSATRNGLNALGISDIPFIGKRITNSAAKFTGNVAGNIGSQIDAKIFGTKIINKNKGARLTDLQIQTSAYGEFIPQVFGQARIAGNIIWARPIKETANVTSINSGGGKGGSAKAVKKTETRFTYSATFAVALCEGEIDDVLNVWADAKIINPANYCASYKVYKGTESQTPDSTIEAFEGTGKTPAYSGLAYVVFEDFRLTDFGNRIPNFTFEVKRNFKNSFSGNSAEEMVKAVCLIPGGGEFVYDTQIQNKILGEDVSGDFIQTGKQKRINNNTPYNKADVLLALDDLQKTFPNLEYISIICTWFGNSLDVASCNIYPAVEEKTGIATTPNSWNVAGISRANAALISRDENNRANYGGTPSDSSIINLIDEIKSRGLKVVFYPMLFMDTSGKPWRGRITGDEAAISNFFNKANGYNNFILHYANLVKNKADAFIIGSEFKGLTSIKNSANNFPAVDEFIALATAVKTIMGVSTKISYAADWSEYHSVGGWYNMDKLWASSAIDFIGIDAYFPLTDAPQNNIYNLQSVINGWSEGEGYNWYYTDEARTTKANLGAAYAWKNIEYWWSNTHTNPNGAQTNWVPQSKKIWFTEYGFPSTDGATNQPNVFYNPNSSDGALPHFSKGLVDFQAQRLGIEATELKWQNSNMIEHKFLWCFDARPYPYWPNFLDIWSDGGVYPLGHWVNGKLGASGLAEVLAHFCDLAKIPLSKIDVSEIVQNLDGFVLKSRENIFDIIQTLQDVYFFNIVEVDGKLRFELPKQQTDFEISADDFIADAKNPSKTLLEVFDAQTSLPTKFDFSFLNKNANYQIANQHAEYAAATGVDKISNKIPIVLENSQAQKIAQATLLKNYTENKNYIFGLGKKYSNITSGSLVEFNGNNLLVENVITQANNNEILIAAKSYDGSIYNFNAHNSEYIFTQNSSANDDFDSEIITHILDLPALPNAEVNATKLHFACTSKNIWNGAEIFASDDNGASYTKIATVENEAVIGTCLNILAPASPHIFDEVNYIDVALLSGNLDGKALLNILNGANAAIIGDEIIQFTNAELIAENKYRLNSLLRGRLGTEDKIATHITLESFILLDNLLVEVNISESFIGKSRKYKIVPVGKNLLEVEPIDFTYNANSLRPYNVVNISGARDVSGNLSINWQRRTRANGDLKNNVDAPLNEVFEAYEVEIMSGANIVRIISTNSQNASYTAAAQITDFGTVQNNISVKIYQMSEVLGRGKVASSTL
jgi:hypothetical protein